MREIKNTAYVQWIVNSPVGRLYLVASDVGLRGVYWQRQTARKAKSLSDPERAVAHLATAALQLEEYFRGERRRFRVSLDLSGTEFQRKVWRALHAIPYGKTCAYRDLASEVGSARAVRAVGTANGRNPLCIIVPCHRVITATGKLGGYSGGLRAKESLLALEGIHFPKRLTTRKRTSGTR